MENEKNPRMEDLLAAPEMGQEIGPDENAVASAGLIQHEDAELERIIHETKAMEDPHGEEDFDAMPAESLPEPEPVP